MEARRRKERSFDGGAEAGLGWLEEDDGAAVAVDVGTEYPRSGLNAELGMGVLTASAVIESVVDDAIAAVDVRSGAGGL